MALDAANFISELSITDPPGSDPLSQGDDQIRTIKRATFNSFAFVDKAVLLTADQLNLAAIKNEANVFTAVQTIQDNALILDAVADVGATIDMKRAGVFRWSLSFSPDATNNEFVLARFSDLGAFIDRPFEIDRATGILNFAQVPTIAGAPIWTAGEVKLLIQGATAPGTNWFIANGTNGTLGLQDRLLGAQGVFFGTQSPFLDAQTTVGPTTGSHILTAAQMPVHNHRLWSSLADGGITDVQFNQFERTVTGANRGNPAPGFRNTSAFGDTLIENAGSGSGHTHTIPELEVETASNDAFQVMPFTYFMQVFQYVP